MTAEFINGNMAAALAAKHSRVQVVAAYPITPQTHTVEYLAQFVADGELEARMVKVESEHSALSACAGASSVGARTFTASCSQGIALMTEVLYFTSGMRFPVVMAVANRTLSVPVNIWADHQDTLVNRDSGWLQLYTGSVQEVYDLVLSAFRIAEDERVSLPCIVSYDGFILSHASEPVQLLSQAEVDRFLPPSRAASRPILDPEKPLQFGEVLFPEWYPDYEYKKHRALADSIHVVQETFDALGELTGRKRGVVDSWYCDDADVVLLGIGSMMQTALHTARRLRKQGKKVGVLNVRCYRPFPDQQVIAALEHAKTVAVLDRDIGYGTSGMVFQDVTRALYTSTARPRALNFIIGTGGKDITPQTIERCVELAVAAKPGDTVLWPDARGPEEGIPYTQGLTL
jgi:pyruvate ferredoxin oxidoreductase alpha subunit